MILKDISANKLNAFVEKDNRQAQAILPELISRLILASTDKIKDFHFPIEDGIQYPDYDGTLSSDEQTPFFPKGKSVWECGISNNIMKKFNDDIEKRSNNPLKTNIEETTFIFATLRIWNHKKSAHELINESKEKYKWANIQIIDASTISMWLEKCPAVSKWLSSKMELPTYGYYTLEEYWNKYSSNTTPELKKDCLLVGRDNEINTLYEWIEKSKEYKIISAETKLEAILFIVSAIISHNKKKYFINRTLIIDNIDTWRDISSREIEGLNILIPTFDYEYLSDINISNNLLILSPIARSSSLIYSIDPSSKINLERLKEADFNKLLELLEYNLNESQKTYITRKFMPLYRKIAKCKPEFEWLNKDDTTELIPLLLVGNWDINFTGDREIIENLSQKSHSEYEQIMVKWRDKENSPIFEQFNKYKIVYIDDIWNLLYKKILSKQINILKKCILDIYTEIIEKELFPESFFAQQNKYSDLLIKGLTTSLVIISEKPENDNSNIPFPKLYVDKIVREIFDLVKSEEHWKAISPLLTLLADASPKIFINKIEIEIENNESNFWRLFDLSKNYLHNSNYHTNLLWALENLSWNETYITRIITILIKISERKIKYNIQNSPLNTLKGIFRLWYPQSCLTIDEKLDQLKEIISDYPYTGWNLIESLLTIRTDIAPQISKSDWHEINNPYPNGITQKEFFDANEQIIDLCIENIGSDIERWVITIDNISIFIPKLDILISKCNEVYKYISEDEIWKICNKLREKIYNSRKYISISEEYVLKLEDLLSRIEPNNIYKYEYLFKRQPHILNPIPYKEKNYSEQNIQERQEITKLRKQVINELLQENDFDKFLKFCSFIEDTSDIGEIILSSVLKNNYNFHLLKEIKNTNKYVYFTLMNLLFTRDKIDIFLEEIQKNNLLSDEEKGETLCNILANFEFWEKLSLLNPTINDYYWNNADIKLLTDNKEIEYYAKKLISYNRPLDLFFTILCSNYYNPELIIELLEKTLKLYEPSKIVNYNHYIKELFEKLYENSYDDINSTVAMLEKSYLPILKDNDMLKYFSLYLAKNPKEFVNLIMKTYISDNKEKLDYNKSNKDESYFAFELLNEFKRIPGCNSNQIDKDIFINWIKEAEEYAKEKEYTTAFNINLGKLFSYSPNGSDGIFPHEIIREYIEQGVSDNLKTSFILGKYNQRGAYFHTGGREEKIISQQYLENAKKIKFRYPKTSAILRELGETYSVESKIAENEE